VLSSTDTKPLPLQAFLPLQAWSALLQLLVPLQELTPSQWPLALALSPAVAVIGMVAKAAAAVAAKATWEILFATFM